MSSASAKVSEPSMEEILASIRRIIADDQETGRAAPSSQPSSDDGILDLADLRASRQGVRVPELAREDVSFQEAEEPAAESEPAVEEEEVDPEPNLSFEAPVAPPARATPDPEPLLSQKAHTTAAHAFQKLSTTVLSANPRTLEDLVTDMLRPMLKTWLDENLPPLVERLVRAEIDRVARGGR